MKKRKTGKKQLCVLALALLVSVMAVCGMGPRARAAYLTPRLVVTGADVPGGEVIAGETFELTLHLHNESDRGKLVNVILKLSSPDNAIITDSGSNSVYIETIPANAEYDVTVTMKTDEKLTDRLCALTVTSSYENMWRDPFTDTATVYIPVRQAPQTVRLSASEMKVTRQEIYVEGKTSLSMKLNNLGRAKIYNASVAFSGAGIDDISCYVGAIEVGKSSTVDISLTGRHGSSDGITALITYENETGDVSSLEEKIPLTVLAYEAEEEVYEEQSGVPVMTIVGAALCVVGAAMILSSVISRRKEKKYE